MGIIDYKIKPRTKKRITLAVETEKTIKALIITLTAMILVLGTTFIMTLSQTTQRGYALEQAKLKNEHLKDENTNLSTKITEATTYHSLENSPEISDMNKTENKTFVTEKDNEVK